MEADEEGFNVEVLENGRKFQINSQVMKFKRTLLNLNETS